MTAPDAPDDCAQCGHSFDLHNDGCLDGWQMIDGEFGPGPDACLCARYDGPVLQRCVCQWEGEHDAGDET